MLFRESLIWRQQNNAGEIFVLAMFAGIMPVLQQVDVHNKRLSASCGVLQAELVQIVFVVKGHISVFRPMPVEAFHKGVEFRQQALTIAEKPVQIDFHKKQS